MSTDDSAENCIDTGVIWRRAQQAEDKALLDAKDERIRALESVCERVADSLAPAGAYMEEGDRTTLAALLRNVARSK